jgi:hypothetical protein
LAASFGHFDIFDTFSRFFTFSSFAIIFDIAAIDDFLRYDSFQPRRFSSLLFHADIFATDSFEYAFAAISISPIFLHFFRFQPAPSVFFAFSERLSPAFDSFFIFELAQLSQLQARYD